MTDDDPRTVADVLEKAMLGWDAIGYVDPELQPILNMPYDQFRRRLRLGEILDRTSGERSLDEIERIVSMGERAEQAHAYDTIFVGDMADPYRIGWNGCLDHIRGNQ